MLEKVTIFITRERGGRQELLLFRHPYAGIQLPAGTVEPGETPEQAAHRETAEETGLTNVILTAHLGTETWEPPSGHYPLIAPATVYARPDKTSFAWATLPRGSGINVHRRQPPFAHGTYLEWDDLLDPHYITYQITGWVDEACLGTSVFRHFFHMQTISETPASWHVFTDSHQFTLFWSPFDTLPTLQPVHHAWLRHFPA